MCACVNSDVFNKCITAPSTINYVVIQKYTSLVLYSFTNLNDKFAPKLWLLNIYISLLNVKIFR
jgi:hypothetical protein